MSKESVGTGTVMFLIITVVTGFVLLKIAVEGMVGIVVFDTGIVKGLLPVAVDVPLPDVPVDVPVPDVPVDVPLPDCPDDVPLPDGPVDVPVEFPEDIGVVIIVATPFFTSTVVGWVLPVPGTALNQIVKTNLPETIAVL